MFDLNPYWEDLKKVSMTIQKYLPSKPRPEVLFILTVVFLVSLLLWNMKRPCPSVETTGFTTTTSVTHLDTSESFIRGKIIAEDRNIAECPIVDFLASIDPTARLAYDKQLVCDGKAKTSDILCRIHLHQLGLGHLEDSACRLNNLGKVPKIVYFVIFGQYPSRFWHYIALKAARKYLNASAIYVIGDQHPSGHWWEMVLKEVEGVRFVYREKPMFISGKPVKYPHHYSDIVRLQVLLLNGGIYLDADMVVLRDLEPLLDYNITLALIDKASGMGNAFMVAKRRNAFLWEWYANYTVYLPEKIYWNSLQVGRDIWYKNTSRVHMESDRVYRPNWYEADLLFKRPDYPWRRNYAVHVWTNGNQVPQSPAEIETANTTVAQIFRYVLYGNSKSRAKSTA